MFANKDDFLSIEREKQTTLVTSAFRSNHVTIFCGLVTSNGGHVRGTNMEGFCELVSFHCAFRKKKTCLKCNMVMYRKPRLLFFLCLRFSDMASNLTIWKRKFTNNPPSSPEFPGPLTPPPLWNFQFPPWWGYGYFLEPHNMAFSDVISIFFGEFPGRDSHQFHGNRWSKIITA